MSHGYAPVRKLAATDEVDAFDCGQPALNKFLQRYDSYHLFLMLKDLKALLV